MDEPQGPWYDEFASEEERIYDEAVGKIREGVKKALSFDEACALVDVADEELKAAIVDDALKVIIAEMHFVGNRPLAEVAAAIKVPLERLEEAKGEMLRDVEDAAIEQYKLSIGQAGTA